MKCDNYSEWMSERLDGALDNERAQRLDSHLENCSECRREWRELEQSWQMLGQLPELEPSPLFRAQVWEKIRLAPPPQLSLWSRWRGLWAGAGVALAGLALTLSFGSSLLAVPSSPAPAVIASASPTQVEIEDEVELPRMALSDWDASVNEMPDFDYTESESTSLDPLPLGDLSHEYLAWSDSALDETLEGL